MSNKTRETLQYICIMIAVVSLAVIFGILIGYLCTL